MATYRALSIEDGNLQSNALVTARSKQYKDVDLSFTPDEDKKIIRNI